MVAGGFMKLPRGDAEGIYGTSHGGSFSGCKYWSWVRGCCFSEQWSLHHQDENGMLREGAGIANGDRAAAGGAADEDRPPPPTPAPPRKAFFMCVTIMNPKIKKPSSAIGLTDPRRMLWRYTISSEICRTCPYHESLRCSILATSKSCSDCSGFLYPLHQALLHPS